MNKVILTFSFLCICLGLFAKNKDLYIELKNEVFTIGDHNFYISTVLDERIDTSTIGFAQTGAFNKKVNAKLSGGVESSFYNFISNSIPQEEGLSEVILKIQEFDISEITTFSTETGEAILKVHFYAFNEARELVKVFEAEAIASGQALDVTKGHEKRIREVIIDCLRKLATSSWQENLKTAPATATIVGNDSAASKAKISDDILINAKNPRYTYHGRSYLSLSELDFVLLNSKDQTIVDDFKRYKKTQGIANVFASLGGVLIGYPLGVAIASGDLNTDVMLSGVGFFVIALAIQGKANKNAMPMIERFNSQNNTSYHFTSPNPRGFRLSYTFNF